MKKQPLQSILFSLLWFGSLCNTVSTILSITLEIEIWIEIGRFNLLSLHENQNKNNPQSDMTADEQKAAGLKINSPQF